MYLAQIKNPILPRQFNPLGTPEAAPGFLGDVLSVIISSLIVVALILFIFLFIVGAIRWIISSGDKAQIENARSTIVNAVIGLIFVLSVYAVLKFIGTVFGIDILNLDLSPIRLK